MPQKTYFIPVAKGILSPEHHKKIGNAIWEFLWCIDRITEIKDGKGIVLGGRPILLKEIMKDLGLSKNAVFNNLTTLSESGYIEKTRTPHGVVIRVSKAKKLFQKSVPNTVIDCPINSESQETVNHRKQGLSVPKTGIVNKDKTLDKTITTNVVRADAPRGNPAIDELVEHLQLRLDVNRLDGTVKGNRQYAWMFIKKHGQGDHAKAVMIGKKLIDAALADSFHSKNMTEMKYLYYNAMKIYGAVKNRKSNVIEI